jgi:hypothetical protein
MGVITSLVLFLGTIVLNDLLREKPKVARSRPKGRDEFGVPTASKSRLIPIIWGRVLVRSPNIIWFDDVRFQQKTKKETSGLIIQKTVRIPLYTLYYAGLQMGICEGPGVILYGIRAENRDLWSGTAVGGDVVSINNFALFGADLQAGGGGFRGDFAFYDGNNAAADPYLVPFQETAEGEDDAPTYNRLAHWVWRGGWIGTRPTIPPLAFEVGRFPNPLSLSASVNVFNDGRSLNPVSALIEIYTDPKFQFNLSLSDFNTSVWTAAAATLANEGNGVQIQLLEAEDAPDIIEEILRQIDAFVDLNGATGKVEITLVRDDYDVEDTRVVEDATGLVRVENYSRPDWEDTTNQVLVRYENSLDSFLSDVAPAQAGGNARLQGGGTINPVTEQIEFIGVQHPLLAARLAWRELRSKAVPLARATLVLDQRFHDLRRGDVVRLNYPERGVVELPMRVGKIDYGDGIENEILAECVEDIYATPVAAFAPPSITLSEIPDNTVESVGSEDLIVFEAPRRFYILAGANPDVDRYALRPGDGMVDSSYEDYAIAGGLFSSIRAVRNLASATYTTKYRASGRSWANSYLIADIDFSEVASLAAALAQGTQTNPIPSLLLTGFPSSRDDFIAATVDITTDPGSPSTDLTNLALIGDEFILFERAVANGNQIELINVYRGVLDSVQGDHALGAPVKLVTGGGTSGIAGPLVGYEGDHTLTIGVRSVNGSFGDLVNVPITFENRALRPSPPVGPILAGTLYGAATLEASGSGLNGFSIPVTWRRRAIEPADEFTALTTDDASVSDQSTEYSVGVEFGGVSIVSFDGVPTATGETPWAAGAGPISIKRADLLATAAAGSILRVYIRTRHDLAGYIDLEALQDAEFSYTPTSVYTGKFYLGGNTTTLPNAYTVTEAGEHTVTIGGAYSTAAVQARINGGTWTTIIAATNTTGTLGTLSVDDTVELRATASEAPTPNIVQVENPSSTVVAYGSLA